MCVCAGACGAELWSVVWVGRGYDTEAVYSFTVDKNQTGGAGGVTASITDYMTWPRRLPETERHCHHKKRWGMLAAQHTEHKANRAWVKVKGGMGRKTV